MAKRSIVKPSLEDAFSLGKTLGEREALEEVLDLMKELNNTEGLRIYIKARLKALSTENNKNPFKREK